MVTSRLHVDWQCFLHAPDNLLISKLTVAAPLPERMVLVTDRATTAPSPGAEMLACDPPLNAKNPKNRMKPPKAAN